MEKRKEILPVNEIAEELITLASDKNILGRCYIGLNPFVWFLKNPFLKIIIIFINLVYPKIWEF